MDWLQGISYVILLLYFNSIELFHFVRFFLYYFLCFLSVHFCCQIKLHSEYQSSHICLSFTSLIYRKHHVGFLDQSVYYEILMHTVVNSEALSFKQYQLIIQFLIVVVQFLL